MRDRQKRHDVALLAGLGAGAGLIYFLDPEAGRRLRSIVRHAGGRLRHGGLAGDDAALHDRVRAQLGHFLSHPEAVEVIAEDGLVTLRGPVLAHEVDQLLRAVTDLPGVYDVISDV